MNIIFLGAFIPNGLRVKYNYSFDSYYRASESIINSINQIDYVNLKVITSPDLPSYPKSKILLLKGDIEKENQIVSSLNISLIKQVWTIFSMFFAVRKIINKQDKTIVIIPYMVFRHVFTTYLLRFFYKDKVQICQIVPDVFFPKNILLKKVNKLTEKIARENHLFILYTKKIAEYLKIDNKPNIVIEGFSNIRPQSTCSPTDKFIITYTGSLNINYGILRLIDAIKFLNDSLEMHIYGAGDAVDYIIQKAKLDNRIKYFGRVPKHIAEEAMYKSSVLINPRNSTDGEYVEYSFPSKNIEYLGTGIPTILCKLPGMPIEYYDYFIDAGNGTSKEIAEAIKVIINMSQEERMTFGEKAKSFIIDRMNPTNQAKKILDMFQSSY